MRNALARPGATITKVPSECVICTSEVVIETRRRESNRLAGSASASRLCATVRGVVIREENIHAADHGRTPCGRRCRRGWWGRWGRWSADGNGLRHRDALRLRWIRDRERYRTG